MVEKQIKITDIACLTKSNCHISNPAKVEIILNAFVKGGFEKLQFVSDFDFTITRHTGLDGQQIWSTFGMLSRCKSLPESYSYETNKLLKIYKPIELDPSIPIDEKIDKMVEWWLQSSKLLKGMPLDIKDLDEVAAMMNNSIKDGTRDMFSKLNEFNVPLLVFSAGLGNSVIAVLKYHAILLSNVKIISNFLQYNEEGILDGIDHDHIIHTFNKNETALKNTDYYELVQNRDNIIVMGDSIGDAAMADGVPLSSNILKIGFLFDHIEQNLPLYMKSFDIVLIQDETMDIPRAILSLIEN